MGCKSVPIVITQAISYSFILTMWDVNIDVVQKWIGHTDSFILTMWDVNLSILFFMLIAFLAFILTMWDVNSTHFLTHTNHYCLLS